MSPASTLTEVDVEDAETIGGSVLEELTDGASAFRGSLREGTKTDRLTFLGQQSQRRIPGNMIPGRVGCEDVACLLGGIESHRDRAGRVLVALQ